MVLAHEDDEPNPFPYWFGRIVGVFHADVLHTGAASKTSEVQRMDFLWVRWFGRDMQYRSGFKAKRLHRVGFLPGIESLGFLDPTEIIRAVHLIPAFAHGRCNDLLGPSIVRQPKENHQDWVYFYVNMYVFW
jgi:hypothetical protein